MGIHRQGGHRPDGRGALGGIVNDEPQRHRGTEEDVEPRMNTDGHRWGSRKGAKSARGGPGTKGGEMKTPAEQLRQEEFDAARFRGTVRGDRDRVAGYEETIPGHRFIAAAAQSCRGSIIVSFSGDEGNPHVCIEYGPGWVAHGCHPLYAGPLSGLSSPGATLALQPDDCVVNRETPKT